MAFNLFNLFKKTTPPASTAPAAKHAPAPVKAKVNFDDIVDEARREYIKAGQDSWWSVDASTSAVYREKLLALPGNVKALFIQKAVAEINNYRNNRRSYSYNDPQQQKIAVYEAFMRQLLKTKIELTDDDITCIADSFMKHATHVSGTNILQWPLNLLVAQIERQLKQRPLTGELKALLKLLDGKLDNKGAQSYNPKECIKLRERISLLLFEGVEGAVKPTYFTTGDFFAAYANPQLDALPPASKPNWFKLMILAQKATGGKPTAKFLAESKLVFKEIGPDKFKKTVQDWFNFYIQFKEVENKTDYEYGGRTYTSTSYDGLSGVNLDMLKAFVWICSHFHDRTTLSTIAALAERCYRKIPGIGPAAPGLGNGCLYTLAKSKGLDGVAYLSRLKLRIKQSNTQALIEKYLQEAADEQGISVHEIEDLAVDDYGLAEGSAEYMFDNYRAMLSIEGIGKTQLQWFKPDGTEQKSVPAFVKDNYKAKLKKLKDDAGEIEITLTVQRDRLDRMLKANRTITWPQFNEIYIQHGLLGYICKKLIWNFETGGVTTPVIMQNGQWVNAKSEAFAGMNGSTAVSLWHPVNGSIKQVTAWREYMLQHKIVQPMKQACREVYLLTDAELNTRTYSNRMAAHLLKQHQFNTLAKTRGWKYSLLGAYDNGRDNETASINLPGYNLKAEFWINEVNADDAMSDSGIWLYVATDQLRFANMLTSQVLNMVDIPPVPFSEIMRDADLFVGVASVGNDPNWRDSGVLPAYRDYWQSYSFGDLSELAKERKATLERLLPRLAIAPVAQIKDKFLVVKGKLRTYKIHIGSTNILMEPNDQYLCIVPDRSAKTGTENVFLPFEGDNGLSVILSKAVMLANDTAITDATITSQIKRK